MATELRETLLYYARFHQSRCARCAALVVLGSLLEADTDVLKVLADAMLDAPDVVEGARLAIGRLRRVHDEGYSWA